jgi:hypothetical protein
VTLQWNNILVVTEMTASQFSLSMPAGKMLDTKAYLVFKLCIHLYDHSGGIMTPAIKIHDQPDAFKYVMACIVFGSRNCIGFDPTISINPKAMKLLSGVFWAQSIKRLP